LGEKKEMTEEKDLTSLELKDIREFMRVYKGASFAGRFLRNLVVVIAGFIIAWEIIWKRIVGSE